MNIKKIVHLILYLLAFSLALALLLGFANDLHPLFDSFSHFRVHLLMALLPLLLLLAFFHETRGAIVYLMLVVLGGFYLYTITQPFKAPLPIEQTKTQPLKHLQFNLSFRNQKIEAFKAYLKEEKPDIVTLQEVTPAHKKALQAMQKEPYSLTLTKSFPYISQKKGEYPYQIYCDFQAVGGVAILSKYPINPQKSVCLDHQGLVWAEVATPKHPINVLSIHTFWPYPYQQPKQIETILPIFHHIKPPTLIAGDFNAAAWSHTIKAIERASNTKVVEGMRWSLNFKEQLSFPINFKLAIDHLLLSKEFQVASIATLNDLGSDHLPILSTLYY